MTSPHSSQQGRQPSASRRKKAERPLDGHDGPLQIVGPWLSNKEAAIYTRQPTMGAYYEWKRRHGLTPGRCVRVAELDRALSQGRRRRSLRRVS